MNTLRLRAEHGAQKFYNKRQNEPIEALAGDGAGNVTPTAKHGAGWDYVRIGGDANDVHEAKNSSGHTFTEDDSVLIQWVKRTGLGFYEIIGYSGSAVYDNPSDTTQTTVRAHASQHERRDLGTGGFDPLDVYARMIVPLRARAQTSPNLTLHVEAGYNPLTGNYYAGGDSAAFAPPTGLAQAEVDLLYLGSDDALHIVAGTPVAGSSPALPTIPNPSVPLAFVYLSVGQTTITEANIYRDPGILRAPVGAINSGVTSLSKSGSALLVGDVTLSEGANITLTQSGQNIEIAASGAGGGHTIQDEGTPLTARTNLNFVGAGVTATDDAGNDATVVTIPVAGDMLQSVYDTDADGIVDDSEAVNGQVAAKPITASETLAQYDLVSIWSDAGAAKVRKADCTNGYRADGFVLFNVSAGSPATVYLWGTLSGLAGLTPGTRQYLGNSGARSETPPTSSGEIVQEVGVALSAGALRFAPQLPSILLA